MVKSLIKKRIESLDNTNEKKVEKVLRIEYNLREETMQL